MTLRELLAWVPSFAGSGWTLLLRQHMEQVQLLVEQVEEINQALAVAMHPGILRALEGPIRRTVLPAGSAG